MAAYPLPERGCGPSVGLGRIRQSAPVAHARRRSCAGGPRDLTGLRLGRATTLQRTPLDALPRVRAGGRSRNMHRPVAEDWLPHQTRERCACVGDRSVTLVAAGDQTLGRGRTLGATGQPTRDREAPCGGTGTSSSNVPTAKSSSGRMPPAAKQRGSPKGRATADHPAPFQCGSKSGKLLRPTRRAAACSRAGGRAWHPLRFPRGAVCAVDP